MAPCHSPQDTPRRSPLGTVAPIGFEDFASPDWLACFRELGCEVVQAYRNQERLVGIEQMLDYIAAGEMPCDSLHGVYGEQYDPSAPDEEARRSAVDTFKAEGELALKLGGPLVIVHCSTIRHEGVPPEERARRMDQLKKSVAELGEFGQTMGVRYAFENLPTYHPLGADVAELVGMLADLDAPCTGLCFDTGHANMCEDAPAAVRRTDGRLVYVHFCDNDGVGDNHEMPTYGTLDTDAVAAALREVGYRGTVMLEIFHPIQRLREFIADRCGERLGRFLRIANGELAPGQTP